MVQDVEVDAKTPKPLIRAFCRGCGYPLRGLPEDGACPECGGAILESLRAPPDLTAMPLWWLGRVNRGLWLILAGWIALFAPIMGRIVAYLASVTWPLTSVGPAGVVAVVAVVSALVLCIGVWVSTPYDPTLEDFPRLRRTRDAMRVFLILSVSCVVVPPLVLFACLWILCLLYACTRWAYDIAALQPIDARPLSRACLMLPFVVIVSALLAAGLRGDIPGAVALVVFLASWVMTSYAILRALRAVRQALTMARAGR